MLSAPYRNILKSTVPLLESGGEALTTHFYRMMLGEYPQVRPLFNQAHQASGAQPRALANAVLMYARHIDELEKLGGLVTQIIQKHVALQILPEHYPIVGTCLMRAIREVLGEQVATPEVMEAWTAAYEQLATLLIASEKQLYDEKAQTRGGWRGGRMFRVVRKEKESEEITSFYLRPEDGGPLMPFAPGQYIGMRLFIDGVETRRNYSLSAAANGEHYRISVKREPQGKASAYLHERVHPGDTLELFPPAGGFTLRPSTKPLVLISGGVGITPTLAMLTAALPQGRPIHFIHCARNARVHAFREWVDRQAQAHPHLRRFYCHAEATEGAAPPDAVGLLDREQLARWLPAERDIDVYFLGPKPFMAAIKRALKELGVPENQCHYEFFGPAEALA
ncbi:nitric oxide dioxygenase [Stigmatella aurantiaca]|uniref:Flavohemoprotein n=1 Tax=Stigmatella aurantiaca TaxID=41 RepID=A0A1H7UY00_STIAU|nr:NO-inducible flavohemoprotein [Stigmatella aurantiaca]SEM01535.1 nitric oxide dioxygenase [Stigmatella aurantiaca]